MSESRCPHCGGPLQADAIEVDAIEVDAAKQAGERLLAKYRRDAAELRPAPDAWSEVFAAYQQAEAIELDAAEKAAMAPPRRSPTFITKAGN